MSQCRNSVSWRQKRSCSFRTFMNQHYCSPEHSAEARLSSSPGPPEEYEDVESWSWHSSSQRATNVVGRCPTPGQTASASRCLHGRWVGYWLFCGPAAGPGRWSLDGEFPFALDPSSETRMMDRRSTSVTGDLVRGCNKLPSPPST